MQHTVNLITDDGYQKDIHSISNILNNMRLILCIFVPLGIWKIVDLLIWIIKHTGG